MSKNKSVTSSNNNARVTAMVKNFGDDTALLVDLYGVDCVIASRVAGGVAGRLECGADPVDAVMEDVNEAYQHREPQAMVVQCLGQRIEIDLCVAGARSRPNCQMSGAVDVNVALPPAPEVVGVAGLLYGPHG